MANIFYILAFIFINFITHAVVPIAQNTTNNIILKT